MTFNKLSIIIPVYCERDATQAMLNNEEKTVNDILARVEAVAANMLKKLTTPRF